MLWILKGDKKVDLLLASEDGFEVYLSDSPTKSCNFQIRYIYDSGHS